MYVYVRFMRVGLCIYIYISLNCMLFFKCTMRLFIISIFRILFFKTSLLNKNRNWPKLTCMLGNEVICIQEGLQPNFTNIYMCSFWDIYVYIYIDMCMCVCVYVCERRQQLTTLCLNEEESSRLEVIKNQFVNTNGRLRRVCVGFYTAGRVGVHVQ